MASFVVELRTREIVIRKELIASEFNLWHYLWHLLPKEFEWLVMVSILNAALIAYYILHHWWQQYEYRPPPAWRVFGLACMDALVVKLPTVSNQTIKTNLKKPIKSLHSQ
jgi:putative ABC transport system permease protein